MCFFHTPAAEKKEVLNIGKNSLFFKVLTSSNVCVGEEIYILLLQRIYKNDYLNRYILIKFKIQSARRECLVLVIPAAKFDS